jgi:hypothetical protein
MSDHRQRGRAAIRTVSLMSVMFRGIDVSELRVVIESGVDHGGNPVEPFEDVDGGWPLRCCLADSLRGDRIAIIAWRHDEVIGPYRETGPIVVHADSCAGAGIVERLPGALDLRQMYLRPYDLDHRIVYASVRLVPDGESNTVAAAALLEIPEVAFVHGRNVRGGCFAFAVSDST